MIGRPRKMRITSWSGDPPGCGEYMLSNGGSAYVVISFRPTRGPAPKSVGSLELVRLEREERIPTGSVVHRFTWDSRRRRRR
jgi:hypothetical protein